MPSEKVSYTMTEPYNAGLALHQLLTPLCATSFVPTSGDEPKGEEADAKEEADEEAAAAAAAAAKAAAEVAAKAAGAAEEAGVMGAGGAGGAAWPPGQRGRSTEGK